ncbi:921_t:CDS:2, partial [Acaulospora morrowiae]
GKNAFGEAIKFRGGKPIKLLNYDQEKEEIHINESALNILNEIDEPVAVIAIVGSFRRGKSWFANVLHGRHDGFELGAELEGCTRGIDMWDAPFLHEGKRVIVLDCEGIDEPRQDQRWATKLFVLSLVLSSSFIYNINGIVGKSDIGKLFLMTDLTKYINPPKDSKIFPRLVVLLRDFMLKSPDDFREYFLQRLDEANSDAANGIREYFEDFDVYGLPYPGVQREQLQYMDRVNTDSLDLDFVSEVVQSVNGVLSKVKPKYIGSSSMSGATFSKFLVECVEKLNDPENQIRLSIPDEYNSVIIYVAQRTIQKCGGIYMSTMEKEIETLKFPIQWSEFGSVHNKAFNIAETEFSKSIIGTAPQIVNFQLEFQTEIENMKKKLQQANSEALFDHNNLLAENLWESYVKNGLNSDNPFSSKEDFEEAVGIFEVESEDLMIPSPEADKVIADFKSKKYKDAVNKLESIGVLQSKLAEEMRTNQDAQQKLLECSARENEMITKLEDLKSEREEMKHQFEKKMEEMNNTLQEQDIRNQRILGEIKEERELAALMLESAKDHAIIEYEKELAKLKKDKEYWRDILKSCIPVVEVGLKFLMAIFVKKYL